jgi:hypothetical protein
VGEENTKCFHAMATQRYNTIASLRSESGDTITDHHQMARIALNTFKERMR